MYAACSGLYIDYPQACQYKNLTKEDTVESKGALFTDTGIMIIHKI